MNVQQHHQKVAMVESCSALWYFLSVPGIRILSWYLTQATGEDKYTEICQVDMNMFKKASVYQIIALDPGGRKIESI